MQSMCHVIMLFANANDNDYCLDAQASYKVIVKGYIKCQTRVINGHRVTRLNQWMRSIIVRLLDASCVLIEQCQVIYEEVESVKQAEGMLNNLFSLHLACTMQANIILIVSTIDTQLNTNTNNNHYHYTINSVLNTNLSDNDNRYRLITCLCLHSAQMRIIPI